MLQRPVDNIKQSNVGGIRALEREKRKCGIEKASEGTWPTLPKLGQNVNIQIHTDQQPQVGEA